MDLSRILIQDGSEHQVIFLRERNGESESAREFPIVIGDPEALAIDRKTCFCRTQNFSDQ